VSIYITIKETRLVKKTFEKNFGVDVMNYPQVKGRLEKNYPLKKLCTWRIGGIADTVFWPESIQDLVQMVRWCKQKGEPVFFLGRGSNVLFPDAGLRGLVIVTTDLNKILWQQQTVTVEAGYSLMLLAREAAARGLQGLEFACGIPGTVGAAVAINAGAYGSAIGDLVRQLIVLTAETEIIALKQGDFSFGYRTSSLQQAGVLVLECTLELNPGADSSGLKETMAKYMAKRRETQPLEYPNAGSVFRNPAGDSAGRLIELAGWKGRRIGDAEVSEKHANFIINRGNATSEQVLRLITEIQRDVQEKFGVRLEPEVRVISG